MNFYITVTMTLFLTSPRQEEQKNSVGTKEKTSFAVSFLSLSFIQIKVIGFIQSTSALPQGGQDFGFKLP